MYIQSSLKTDFHDDYDNENLDTKNINEIEIVNDSTGRVYHGSSECHYIDFFNAFVNNKNQKEFKKWIKKVLFIYGRPEIGKSTYIYKKCNEDDNDKIYRLNTKDITFNKNNETLDYKLIEENGNNKKSSFVPVIN